MNEGETVLNSINSWPQCNGIDRDYISWPHWHSEAEMLFVFSGYIDVDVEKQSYRVSGGQGLCICEGVTHYYHKNTENAPAVVVKFTSEMLSRVYAAKSLNELYGRVFKILPDERILALARSLPDGELGEYRKFAQFAKLTEITARLMAKPEYSVEVKTVHFASNRQYLRAAQAYMAKNANDTLTLDMLADHLGLTRSYCSKYIKEQTGMPFIVYLNRLRITNAELLLVYSDAGVTEIAEKTGFNSIQTFNRVFKKLTGVSPSAYRKAQKRIYTE